jgi:opacity protein-like surface antigen
LPDAAAGGTIPDAASAAITREVRVRWSIRAVGTLAVASLLITTAPAAQGIRATHFGVAAGLAVPAGSYHAAANGEGFSSGWQAMALAVFTVPGWPVDIRVDGTYGTNSANDRLKADLTARLGQPTDEKVKLLGANVAATYSLRSGARVRPYVLGGLGVYHVTISLTSGGTTTDDAATKLAWHLGAGIAYHLQGTALFLEARYLSVAAFASFPRTTFFPIAAGVRFGRFS